jgi:hypothetical protein
VLFTLVLFSNYRYRNATRAVGQGILSSEIWSKGTVVIVKLGRRPMQVLYSSESTSYDEQGWAEPVE